MWSPPAHPRSPLRTTISTNLRLNQEQNENITFWILISLIEVRSEKFYIFGCHLSDAAVVHYYQQSHPWFHLISLCFKLIIIHYHTPLPPHPPKKGVIQTKWNPVKAGSRYQRELSNTVFKHALRINIAAFH